MARIRKFAAYRRLERPYTRMSKFREKSFIRAAPHLVLNKFTMGDPTKEFPIKLNLIAKNPVQIRHNAFESGRMTTNRYLERNLGKKAYCFRIVVYPHHILRENPLASGAGADRMSTGMKCSFGKAISRAAQIKAGQTIFTVWVAESNIEVAKKALDRAKHKFPCSCAVVFDEGKNKKTIAKKTVKVVSKEQKPVTPASKPKAEPAPASKAEPIPAPEVKAEPVSKTEVKEKEEVVSKVESSEEKPEIKSVA